MKQFTTEEGHEFLVVHDPMGVMITVIPAEPTLDEGVRDVFGLGIRFSNLVRAIREIDLPGGFQGEGWDSSMRREGDKIHFSFAYSHAPDKRFTTSLSKADSKRLIGFLQDSIEGRTVESEENRQFEKLSKLGRNESCLCGSGKKYKKCCGNPSAIQRTAMSLRGFRDARDPTAQKMIAEASGKPAPIDDPAFWMDLGCTLGTAEEYPLALKALENALELDVENPKIIANYAATLEAVGRDEEALKLLQGLPNESGEFSVLIGNVLCGLNREIEALQYYEEAIKFEPEFYFTWQRLLHVLKTTSNPLYEYWVCRAHQEFPQTPVIALAYSHWLISENRLKELAEAEWVEWLKHNPDPRVMGRGENNPRMIVEVQVLRMIAKSLFDEDLEPLIEAVKVLEAAPEDWHLCVPAEQIALAARFFGQRDLVSQASRSFCRDCASGRLGPVFLQTLLAEAAAVAHDNDQVILDAETGLKESPDDLALRNVYWWALDEVGRSDEALEVAKGLQNDGPGLPDLCYNIGYIAGKIGKPATAIAYYNREIEQESDHAFAIENLALHRLIQEDLAEARSLVSQWKVIVFTNYDPEQVDAKLRKFEELFEFTRNNSGSVSLAFDLLKLNESSEPFFGAETKIPPQSPTREEIVEILSDTDPERKNEITYALAMQQRGDYSTVVSALEADLPGFREVPLEAFVSIVEGQCQLDEARRADFAPCCMAFCKGLEIFLFERIFQTFRKDVQGSASIDKMIEDAEDPKFEKAESFVRFISKGAPLELGTMAFTLNLCRGNTAKKMQLLGALRDWIKSNSYGHLIEQQTADEIAAIAKDYRNPAAHSRPFVRDDVLAAKQLCFKQLGDLLIASQVES